MSKGRLHIDYDHQIFAMQKFGGISRYVFELARRVAHADGFSASIIAPLHVNAYLCDGGAHVRGIRVPQMARSGSAIKALSAELSSVRYLFAARPDIVHETYYSARRIAPRGCPTVVTVHDMIHEKFPQYFHADDQTSARKRKAIARADHVICVSHSTRRDLLALCDVAPEKTSVVHHGVGIAVANTLSASVTGSRPYILYVGERGGYKNFTALLTAYASSTELRRSVALFAFGGGGFQPHEKELIRRLSLDDTAVRQVSGGDDVLASLYRHAVMLVYPSLYEGFGIPLLEAMSLDCPVVCGDKSSIPEVVGDAALVCDSSDIDALRTSMDIVARSADTREGLISRGRSRIQLFAWERCAAETMEVYKTVAQ
jgi:glycosyltransferase involved in cell wall biosynthesis